MPFLGSGSSSSHPVASSGTKTRPDCCACKHRRNCAALICGGSGLTDSRRVRLRRRCRGILARLDKPARIGEDVSMPYQDFTVETLAKYLHLSPGQVAKLADRGKLPGRKVGGEWRFAKPDIHHWLERRIGLSDSMELIEVEAVLRKSEPLDEQTDPCLADMMPIEAVSVPLAARTRNSVVDKMVALAEATGMLWDAREMAEAVKAREDMHSTALGNGVALLHPRRPMAKILAQPLMALGVTGSGIPFGGDATTDVFFLICSTEDRGHLRTLARLSRVIATPGFLDSLRQAENADDAHRIFVETETGL